MKNTPRLVTSRASLIASTLVASAALASACQNTESRELGYTQVDQDLRNQPTQPFYTSPDELIGRWIGTAQDPIAIGRDDTYRFPSGSRQFIVDGELVSDGFGSETLEASVTFGEGALPPPTDPDVGYPAGFSYLAASSYDPEIPFVGTNPDLRLPPFEGFEYRGQVQSLVDDGDLSLSDGLLTIAFNVNQPLDAWCELQTPFPTPGVPGLFQCVETFGGGVDVNPDGTGASCGLRGPNIETDCPDDPSREDIGLCVTQGDTLAVANCDKLFLCTSGFCQCDEASCIAGGGQDQLVLRREGDELVGAFAGTTFLNARNMKTPLGEVRLRRAD